MNHNTLAPHAEPQISITQQYLATFLKHFKGNGGLFSKLKIDAFIDSHTQRQEVPKQASPNLIIFLAALLLER